MSSIDLQNVEMLPASESPEFLDDLVPEHIQQVRSFIFPMVCDPSLADDLTQETFLKAVKFLPQFQRQSQFSTWLCSIAMNTCRDHFRKRKRQAKTASLDSIPTECETDGKAPIPWQRAEQSELSADVRAALMKLAPDLRAAITLVYIHGMQASEAATIEHCTLATMYWRIHQSKKQLGKLLSKYL